MAHHRGALFRLSVLRNKMTSLQSIAKDFENFGKLSPEEQLKKALELATLNNCTRARKCNLVPYKAQGAGNLKGQKGKSKVEPASKGGCCPGQTGHHLIPKSSIKDSCKGFYDHDTAPTVCVEGTSQNMGSHKRVHQALAAEHRELGKDGKVSPDGTMSLDDALDAAADSHAKAFPLSRCSKKCIRAQLESYYRGCRNARPAMVNDQAKKTQPNSDGNRSK